MRTKMIAAAIAAGLTVTSLGALAQSSPTAGSDAAELAQLRAQLATLQARVAQLEQQRAKVAQLERQQQARAAAALPTSDDTGAWTDKTRIGGTMYADFTHLDRTSNGIKSASPGTGLDVKRFYLTVDHDFNDVWSANLTTDFNYVSNDGETQLFVKKAYVQGAFSKLATLRVGSASTPWIPFVENWYGYRFVENTLVDRLKFGNSADWGLHLLGDSGTFDYQVSMLNGGGYKHPDRSNSVDFEARVGFTPVKGFAVAVGGYSGHLGEDTATSPALHDARRYDAMMAWNANGLRLGAEWFRADNWNNVATPVGDAADGWSLWGSYDFSVASVFARYDRVKPSKALDPDLEDTYYNIGMAFPITEGIRAAIAYKNERLRNGTTVDVQSREVGAWGEVKF